MRKHHRVEKNPLSIWQLLIWSFFKKLLQPLTTVHIHIEPHTRQKIQLALQNPSLYKVIFVLPHASRANAWILRLLIEQEYEQKILLKNPKKFYPIIHALRRKRFGILDRKSHFSKELYRILRRQKNQPTESLILAPVLVFWGRSVGKTRPQTFRISDFLFPDEAVITPFHRVLQFLFFRRQIHVHFTSYLELTHQNLSPYMLSNEPNAQEIKEKEKELEEYSQSLTRQINILMNQEKVFALGPQLYDVNKVIDEIVSQHPPEDEHEVAKMVVEIAANYNHRMEYVYDFFLNKLWHHSFKRIAVFYLDQHLSVAKKGQVLWLPTHRSHLDYLLLSYVLQKKGCQPPHIAAGINLKFWPLGSILRQGGAFFIRRRFAGNKLYMSVFSEYVHFLLSRNFSIEFFQEGTRSRTGKLLPPRMGLWQMILNSVMMRKARHTLVIPVNITYEYVLEEKSYLKEMEGSAKKQESLWRFLLTIPKLASQKFGDVYLSCGQPFLIADAWNEFFTRRKDLISSLSSQPIEDTNFFQLENFTPSYERSEGLKQFLIFLGRKVHQNIQIVSVIDPMRLFSSLCFSHNTNTISLPILVQRALSLLRVLKNMAQDLKWPLIFHFDEQKPVIQTLQQSIQTFIERDYTDYFESDRQTILVWTHVHRIKTYWYRNNIYPFLGLLALKSYLYGKINWFSETQIDLLITLWNHDWFLPEEDIMRWLKDGHNIDIGQDQEWIQDLIKLEWMLYKTAFQTCKHFKDTSYSENQFLETWSQLIEQDQSTNLIPESIIKQEKKRMWLNITELGIVHRDHDSQYTSDTKWIETLKPIWHFQEPPSPLDSPSLSMKNPQK